MTLNARAWLALAIVASVMCALLFGTAGTIQYWQAWVYVSIFLGASVLTTLYLMKKDPALLARRMRGGPTFEQERTERIIMVFTSLGFIALLVVAALDHRFVSKLAQPGSSVTGVSGLQTELVAKRLEVLKTLTPAVRRVWLIYYGPDLSATPMIRCARGSGRRLWPPWASGPAWLGR